MDQNPNLSEQLRDIIEIRRVSVSEFNFLTPGIFPKSFINQHSHTTFTDVWKGDLEGLRALTTDVAHDYCLLNTAVNLPANSISDFIIVAGLLHSPNSTIQTEIRFRLISSAQHSSLLHVS
jgi:hypothetical protein